MAIHVMAYLPANAPAGTSDPDALGDNSALKLQVINEAGSLLVGLADIVRRRSNYQLNLSIRDISEES